MTVRPSPPFHDFEVSAILREVAEAGSGKSQFRRPLKPQPVPFIDRKNGMPCEVGLLHVEGRDLPQVTLGRVIIEQKVPFAIGDLLWCRETWKPHSLYAELPPRLIPQTKVFFAADDGYSPSNTPWRSSTQMPRWASRLTLEVVGVKIERLQEISEEDARAEGVVCRGRLDGEPWDHCYFPGVTRGYEAEAATCFSQLWEHLNGDGSWSANPFVHAVTFRPHLVNVDLLRQREGGR